MRIHTSKHNHVNSALNSAMFSGCVTRLHCTHLPSSGVPRYKNFVMTRSEPLDDHLGNSTVTRTIIVFVAFILLTEDMHARWQSDERAWIGRTRSGDEISIRPRHWRWGGTNHQNWCWLSSFQGLPVLSEGIDRWKLLTTIHYRTTRL